MIDIAMRVQTSHRTEVDLTPEPTAAEVSPRAHCRKTDWQRYRSRVIGSHEPT